jgi:hypothetical protein
VCVYIDGDYVKKRREEKKVLESGKKSALIKTQPRRIEIAKHREKSSQDTGLIWLLGCPFHWASALYVSQS